MAVSILNSLFKFRSPLRRTLEGANCESIHLLGNGYFEIEVAGSARFQEELLDLAPSGLARGCFYSTTAQLLIDRLLEGKSQFIDIEIDGQIVGYCPSYLATRYFEWLREWGLTHARVECEARILKKQCRADTISVFLDIDPQFRMTTSKVKRTAEPDIWEGQPAQAS